MTKKKHHYIYVARVFKQNEKKWVYLLSENLMIIDKTGSYATYLGSEIVSFFRKIPKKYKDLKLKKGEQVRIPIDIDKAEVVK